MQAMRGSQKSLILVARQLGVHIGPNDIPEQFKIDERELSPKEMCELANSFSLKAKSTKINDNELIKLLSKKQQILRLKNGLYLFLLQLPHLPLLPLHFVVACQSMPFLQIVHLFQVKLMLHIHLH